MRRKFNIRFLALALTALLISVLAQGTQAYYSTFGTATNVVTSGNITLQIVEKTGLGDDFPQGGVYIIPGDVVSKVVTVENICEHPFYLRVKLVYGTNAEELTPEECLKLNINTENWVYQDGWYYYTDVLQPGEETPYVFSQVEIVGDQINASHIGKVLQLTVKAQAVQSENNPIENGDTSTAQGWPAEKEASR